MPDGKPFSIKLMVEGDARPVMTRAGTMIAQQWRQFGIDATAESAQGSVPDAAQRPATSRPSSAGASRPGAATRTSRSSSTAGTRSSSQPAGKPQPPRNWQRWSNPELDKIIEQIRGVAFDDPKGVELGQEFVKLMVREMPIIPLMSYNVFTVMDQTYWTGYPTAEEPVHQPGPELGATPAT